MERLWTWVTARTAPWLLLTAVAALAAGMAMSALSTPMPGTEARGAEDVVDAVADVLLGGLGVLLVVRGRAEGLGRGLLLATAVGAAGALLSGAADALAAGTDPTWVEQALTLVAGALFIPSVALVVLSPLLLFPTGRLPSPRWRWAAGTAYVGVAVSVLSLLLAPGPVDEDVPGWGSNPWGLGSLSGVVEAAAVAGLVLLAVVVVAGCAAVVLRSVRARGRQRRQMVWFVAGVLPMVVGLVTEPGDSAVAQTAAAVVIFLGLLVGIGWPTLGPLGRPEPVLETSDHAVP